jgi:hypothetical protein
MEPTRHSAAATVGRNGIPPYGGCGQEPLQVTYFSSSTLQYASLTNFDQLAIRTSWAA